MTFDDWLESTEYPTHSHEALLAAWNAATQAAIQVCGDRAFNHWRMAARSEDREAHERLTAYHTAAQDCRNALKLLLA